MEILDNDFHIICIDQKNKNEKYNIGNKLLINKKKIMFSYLYYSKIKIADSTISSLLLRIMMDNKEIIIFPDTHYVLKQEVILSESDLKKILEKDFTIVEKNIREIYKNNMDQFIESVKINIYRYNEKIKEIYEIIRD